MSEKKELHIAVPAGIGDVSWILSKLETAKDEFDFHIEVADGAPYRTVPFLEMLPWIKSAKYGQFTYSDIVIGQRSAGFTTWKEISECGHGLIWLSNNEWLEQGRRLEAWLPDLNTNFHYMIPAGERARMRALSICQQATKKFGEGAKLYGISAASYRGSQAWGTWEYDDWAFFFNLWLEAEPDAHFLLMGGGWDDLTRSLYDEFQDKCIDLVGKTHIATAISLHSHLNGYVGFSSGLGIIRTVLGLNTFMLWPAFQEALSTSWAPSEMLKSGAYTAHLWQRPEKIVEAVQRWLGRLS